MGWFGKNDQPPAIVGDNESSVKVAKNAPPTQRTEYMLLRYQRVREFADDLCHVLTGLNIVDPLTKPMSKPIMLFQNPTLEMDEDINLDVCEEEESFACDLLF